ncbi:MAG: valine--tRNA ligase, partial [Phycisphaerae bacterium]
QGFNACWLPGTDHAGIATQAVVEKRLREETGWVRDNKNPEHREFLVGKIWEWKQEYNARILNQLKRMGCSCDWNRTRFTLDEGCVQAVYETFFKLFSDGLIYRGKRLVNWDTQLQTAVADDEVYHETVRGSLWHIRYPLAEERAEGPRGQGAKEAPASSLDPSAPRPLGPYLIVATTRPETMLADTAVAVHPEDERFKHLIGKRVVLPLSGRTIPVIADDVLVKREFGTGCVKVTPAHDPNDYACWQRKQGQPDAIEIRNMLTPDGKVHADNAGEGGKYAGLKLDEARKRVVADLEAAGLLEKVEPYETEVGHSERSKSPIQPYLSEQWFMRMGALADGTMDAVRDGRVQFYPARYGKTFLDWLGEKRDWCISRQLWWGHRIPVWKRRISVTESNFASIIFGADGLDSLFEQNWGSSQLCWSIFRARDGKRITDWKDEFNPVVSESEGEYEIQVCYGGSDSAIVALLAKAGFDQDPDVLDTWFSSALWPHSTFGWPSGITTEAIQNPKSKIQNGAPLPDLDYFYPTSVLSTARDIITLWVARMVMTGLYNTGRVPFSHVYIHPVIQDAWGARMSKSTGNGMDPLDLIDAYGTDAMRFSLAGMAGDTQDVRVPGSYRCPHCAGEFTQQQSDLKKPTIACRLCKKEFATRVADDTLIREKGLGLLLSPRFEPGRNFVTKLWQAATGFIIPKCADVKFDRTSSVQHTKRSPSQLPDFEKWIRSELLDCIAKLDRALDNYEFAVAVDALRDFFWSYVCDWYVESVKDYLANPGHTDDEKNDVKISLVQVLDISLSLLHPFTPIVTERIWQELGQAIPGHHALVWPEGQKPPADAPALICMPWPQVDDPTGSWLAEVKQQKDAAIGVGQAIAVITALREIRSHINAMRSASKQPAIKTLPHAAVRCSPAIAEKLHHVSAQIHRLGAVEGLAISPDVPRPSDAVSKVLAGGIHVYVQITGLCDIEVERTRLRKEIEELSTHVGRIEANLGNEAFVAKAPPAKVQAERARLDEARAKLTAVQQNLAEVGG